MTNFAGQLAYRVRFDWGLTGLQAIAADDPVVIVVDVLSFSTAVSIALSRGAAVLPFPWRDERGAEYARHHGAWLAGERGAGAYSLSPTSLWCLPARARLVSHRLTVPPSALERHLQRSRRVAFATGEPWLSSRSRSSGPLPSLLPASGGRMDLSDRRSRTCSAPVRSSRDCLGRGQPKLRTPHWLLSRQPTYPMLC
jgi:hypothetical protein